MSACKWCGETELPVYPPKDICVDVIACRERVAKQRDAARDALRLCVPFVNELLSRVPVGKDLWDKAEQAKAAAWKVMGTP